MAYVLEPTMSVTREVQRIARERIDEALDLLDTLNRADSDVERVVHDVRKRCKEVRAVARLVRASLGDEFRRFNRLVGDAADTLAPIRDAHAVLATFDDLRTAGTLAAGVESVDLDDVRSAHATAAEAATDGMNGGDPRIEQARRLLVIAGESIDDWKVDDGFVTLGAGIEETSRTGRRDLRRARKKPTDDRLHEWRKSVKNLWYQTRLVQRVAPSVLQALVASLDDLAEALGDDHDLAVLIERLRSDPDLWEKVSRQTREYFEKELTVEVMTERTEALIRRLWSEDPPQPRTEVAEPIANPDRPDIERIGDVWLPPLPPKPEEKKQKA